MRLLCILYLLLVCLNVSAQVVYKKVKANGNVVYSDFFSEGAVAVNLSYINTVSALNNASSQTSKPINPVKTLNPEVKYSVFIRSPVAEQTLRNNLGTVTINAEISPEKSGDFQFIIDNQTVKTQSKRKLQLENINRGAHTIQVFFLDKSGKTLASSKLQTFYLQKASALIKAN